MHAGSPAPPNATRGRRAYKASYNRPFATRAYRAVNMPFNSELPAVRWLERNGYDVSYWTGVDADRYGGRLVAESTRHKVYLSVGHDEYWSGRQRAAVEAARDHGMSLAFFSGNEVYWRTRWEADAAGASHRTLVVYKETQDIRKIDPKLDEWTGTWRDGRAINPLGPLPENALTGTIYTVNAWRNDPLTVPPQYAPLRFWRNTSIASLTERDAALVLVQGLLGHEWDEDVHNGHRPPGLMHLSESQVDDVQYIFDEGATYDTASATHHLVLYRHPKSRALVFGAGTCQWSWGLDGHHDGANGGLDLRMGQNCYSLRVGVDPLRPGGDRNVQQATMNLFADMGARPATPQPDLTPSLPSSDSRAPTVGAIVTQSDGYLSGTSHDEGGGVVAAVEVLLDGGDAWEAAEVHPATGRWRIGIHRGAGGDASPVGTLRVRAADDSGNLSPNVDVKVS